MSSTYSSVDVSVVYQSLGKKEVNLKANQQKLPRLNHRIWHPRAMAQS